MLPWVCTVIDYKRCQNVTRTEVIHAAMPRVPLFCSQRIWHHLWSISEQAQGTWIVYKLWKKAWKLHTASLISCGRWRHPKWKTSHCAEEQTSKTFLPPICFWPLHPYTSMHILYTVLRTISIGAGKQNFVRLLRTSVVVNHFLYSCDHIQGWYYKEKLDTNHTQGWK